MPDPGGSQYVLQVAVLVLLTFCCYGAQVLAAGQRRRRGAQRISCPRRATAFHGPLGRRVATRSKPAGHHQQRHLLIAKNLARERPEIGQQIAIIREEVAKTDRIITQIMGYAQLTEGRVEKLNVIDELNRAIEEVFPVGVPARAHPPRFRRTVPPLLLQRKHLNDAVSNLLQNARDASPAEGKIYVSARFLPDESIAITVRDEGPGIPPDKAGTDF